MIAIHEVSVVYSGGVLKPFKKLNLVEGQKKYLTPWIMEGSKIREKDIDKAKRIWEKGAEDQIRFLEED